MATEPQSESELTDADLAILFAVELGVDLQPWQMTVMLRTMGVDDGI